jgi:hypothetical protein
MSFNLFPPIASKSSCCDQTLVNVRLQMQVRGLHTSYLRRCKFEKVEPNDPNLAIQVFMQLTEITKAQKGFIRQFWVINGLSCILRR